MNFLKRHKLKSVIILVCAILYWIWLPALLFNDPLSPVLLDTNGELLAAQTARDEQWRFKQEGEIPYRFRQCIVMFEDEYFYSHPGVNPVSLMRAFVNNFGSGRNKSGASTVTMQLARMMRQKKERNYFQKLVEILLAVRIELSYKKSSILNVYCANAPFGGNVVGLPAASWRYFGRSPENLTWAESAVLAVLPNAPGMIYPGKNQERLIKKRDRLLMKLFIKGLIDSSAYKLSLLESLPVKPFPIPQHAPHLLSRCVAENSGTSLFRSTIQKNLQLRVVDLLNRHSRNLTGNQIHNACALVVENQTGKVLAYVGNSSSQGNDHENFVDIIKAPRSTGSILKPFLYAFMLSENKLLPGSLLEDIPTRLGSYGPKNFSLGYDGLVPANQAIARSLNVPAVKMLQEYGIDKFHQRLKQLGFTTFNKPPSHYGLSLILGGGEACLWDLASAYSSMARALNGYSSQKNKYTASNYHQLYFLAAQGTKKNKRMQKSDLFGAAALYYAFNAMTELLRPQDYIGWSQFLSKRRIAWKTGTSFGFRDAWAIGLDPEYTVAVWVGNADGEGRPELTGTTAAAPLLFDIFNILQQKKWFAKPDADLERVAVCTQSGYRASNICPENELKDYPRGASSTKPCPFHKLINLDETGRYRVSSNCYPVNKMKQKAWFVATPAQEYFYKQKSTFYQNLPEYLDGCSDEQSLHRLEILYPRNGFRIYVPVDQSGEKGNCIFKATHKNEQVTLFWHLDQEFIGSTQKFHQISVAPKVGPHQLQVADSYGETSTCNFQVVGK